MSLHRKLTEIVERYKSDIVIVREFISSTDETLDLGKMSITYMRDLTDEDRIALRDVRDFITELEDDVVQKHKQNRETRLKTTARVDEIIVSAVKSIKTKTFFSEMALAYVVSFQEGS